VTLATEYAQAITATASAVSGVTNVGNVLTRFRPVRDWNAVIDELQVTIGGTNVIRTWFVVPGVPVIESDVDAVDGQVFDRLRIALIGLQGAQDDATGFVDALSRAVAVKSALDSLWNYGTGGPVPFQVVPCRIDRHEFRYFGKIGVWWTDLVHTIVVARDYDVNQ
jgi:hypothetical protein